MDSGIIQGKGAQAAAETAAVNTNDENESAKPIAGTYLCSDYEAAIAEYGSFSGKIHSQVAALNNAGLHCTIETYSKPHSFFKKAIRWLPFTPTFEEWPDPSRMASYDYVYMRKPVFTKSFLCYLATLKSLNPHIQLIMELPTYPYDKEFDTPRKKLTLAKEKHHRKQLHKHLDRIADLSGHKTIFDVPTVQVINGIDFEKTPARAPSIAEGTINVLSVSGCQPWHGLDRIIRGLSDYYSQDEQPSSVFLHLVGDGPELENLKHLAKELNLDQHIRFYGEMKRADIGELYNQCTLAFESLGWHRTGVTRSSSIKSREYFAKGIPFIYSCQLDVFEEDPADFCLRISSDDTPVDFNQIITFHEALYSQEEERDLIERIRRYGENHVAMDKAMGNVIAFIKRNPSSREGEQ